MNITPPIPFAERTILRLPLVSASIEAGFPCSADEIGIALDTINYKSQSTFVTISI